MVYPNPLYNVTKENIRVISLHEHEPQRQSSTWSSHVDIDTVTFLREKTPQNLFEKTPQNLFHGHTLLLNFPFSKNYKFAQHNIIRSNVVTLYIQNNTATNNDNKVLHTASYGFTYLVGSQ